MGTEPIFELLSRAIDMAALRQSVHASNIANADVTGYRRMEVSFEQALANVAPGEATREQAMTAGDAAPAQPRVVESAGDAVRLDQEMAQMAQNSVRYQALLTAYEKTMMLLRLAVRDGRE